MNTAPTILIVDDDEGHALLIQQNLAAAGLLNPMERLCDGQAALDFFFAPAGPGRKPPVGAYIVLLDIRMPKVDGIEVLRRLKSDLETRQFPVVMLTTADDLRDIARCYALGCSGYIRKPVAYEKFSDTVRVLGRFAQLLLVPEFRADRTRILAAVE